MGESTGYGEKGRALGPVMWSELPAAPPPPGLEVC